MPRHTPAHQPASPRHSLLHPAPAQPVRPVLSPGRSLRSVLKGTWTPPRAEQGPQLLFCFFFFWRGTISPRALHPRDRAHQVVMHPLLGAEGHGVPPGPCSQNQLGDPPPRLPTPLPPRTPRSQPSSHQLEVPPAPSAASPRVSPAPSTTSSSGRSAVASMGLVRGGPSACGGGSAAAAPPVRQRRCTVGDWWLGGGCSFIEHLEQVGRPHPATGPELHVVKGGPLHPA